jgi:hypothetical protein
MMQLYTSFNLSYNTGFFSCDRIAIGQKSSFSTKFAHSGLHRQGRLILSGDIKISAMSKYPEPLSTDAAYFLFKFGFN